MLREYIREASGKCLGSIGEASGRRRESTGKVRGEHWGMHQLDTAATKSEPGKLTRFYLWGAAALAVLPRLPTLNATMLAPSGEYHFAVMGRAILQGQLPYDGGFDHKPLGMPYLTALFSWLFGPTALAVHLLGLCAVFISAWMLARIAALHAPRSSLPAGSIALAYGLLSLKFGGVETQTELLFCAPMLSALALFLETRRREGSQRTANFAIGALVASALQINYLAATSIAGCALALLGLQVWRGIDRSTLKRGVSMLWWWLLGALAATALLFSPYCFRGDLAAYFDAQVRFLRIYHLATPWQVQLHQLWGYTASLTVVVVAGIGFSLAAARGGMRAKAIDREQADVIAAALGGSLGALLGAFASGRMVAHYFIPLVPPLLLLLWCTAERYAQAGRRRVRVTVIVLLAITVGLSVAALRISAQATLAQWRGGYQGSHADLQGKIADDIGNRPGHPPQSAWVLADSQSAMAISYLSRSQPANWLIYPAHYLDPKVTAAFGTSPQHELQVLFAAQPDFVVVGRGRYAPAAQYGAVSPAVLESFTTALTRDYTQARDYPDLAVGDGFVVYRRRTVDAD